MERFPARDQIRAGGCGDSRLLQHAPGEIKAVAAKARNIGIEIEDAFERQELTTYQTLHEDVAVELVAALDRVHPVAAVESRLSGHLGERRRRDGEFSAPAARSDAPHPQA
jgi:hypothetical protein